MVYDPIRDCEVPSPAVSNPSPWMNNFQTPDSAFNGYHEGREANGRPPQPPAFEETRSFSPSSGSLPTSRSAPSGLRGLLNDERAEAESRRGSGRTSVSSAPDDDYTLHRRSISNLLNDPPSLPLTKSNSASSIAHESSPSNASPGPRPHLDTHGFLTPAQPALRSRLDTSRSPYPSYSASPSSASSALPHDTLRYQYDQAGPSRHRPDGHVMLPPSETRSHEYETPRSHHPRSESVSISPRSHQQPLPATASRPSSSRSTTSHTFSFQPPVLTPYVLSPASSTRRLSDEQRPSSSAPSTSIGKKFPSRRPSQLEAYSPRYSTSPMPPRTTYNPRRLTRPDTVLDPIFPDEIARLKILGQMNNPLRKTKRPLPSWSAPSPGGRHQPSEHDGSYFPDHRPGSANNNHPRSGFVERQASSSSDRPSITPRHNGMEELSKGSSRNGSRNTSGNDNHLKRPSDHDDDRDHDDRRRKVSQSTYVGNVAAVANHYNSRPEVGVQSREFSPIIGLKKFNNWIKSVLIGKFAARKPGGPGACVLDIGCGKGGDLNKWKQARISLYVGLDLAETSVEQAMGRYQTMPRPGFEAAFFAHDCYSKPISDILPDRLKIKDLYDNVTMQFCMHYAFETASKARMMMENVSRYLKKGGIFIGTIPDSELLLDRLNQLPEDDEELQFGNSCYYVQFAQRSHKGVYGHQYSFFLQDAVEDVPEYLVDWENFVALAAEYRLRVVYKKPFNEVLQDEQSSRDFGPLLGKMGVVNQQGESAMDADQWEAANLYMAFAFEKY